MPLTEEEIEFLKSWAEYARSDEAKEQIRRFLDAKERLDREFVERTSEADRIEILMKML